MSKSGFRVVFPLVAVFAIITCARAQEDLAQVPKMRPGELPVDASVLKPINVMLRWASYADGQESEGIPVLIEYDAFIRDWRQTGQIRWLTIGGSWPAYDLMMVDLDTFRVRVRHEPLPEGGVSIRNWNDGQATGVALSLNGEVENWDIEINETAFDIATFPFLFAAMDWSEIDEIQIPLYGNENGVVQDGDVEWYHIKNLGRATYEDSKGEGHDVRRIQVTNHEGNRKIDYYIDSRPPFWFGIIAHDPNGIPTSAARFEDYQLREVNLSDYVDEFIDKKPEE